MKDLSRIREEIDAIDSQIAALYEARMQLTGEVAEYKLSVGKPVLDKEREKEKLEKMLEDDPQFYYHILPYAQVLGVSDKWEEKFADITVEPPQWYASSVAGTVFRLHVFNSIMRNTMSTMTKNMVSRPSSGASGGHGGGHFGGFSGGGHGGGGGHFK